MRELRRWLELDELDASLGIAVDRHADAIDVELSQDGVVAGRRTLPRGETDCATLASAVGIAIAIEPSPSCPNALLPQHNAGVAREAS